MVSYIGLGGAPSQILTLPIHSTPLSLSSYLISLKYLIFVRNARNAVSVNFLAGCKKIPEKRENYCFGQICRKFMHFPSVKFPRLKMCECKQMTNIRYARVLCALCVPCAQSGTTLSTPITIFCIIFLLRFHASCWLWVLNTMMKACFFLFLFMAWTPTLLKSRDTFKV